MAQAFTPGLQISKNYTINKIRELSVPGDLLVKVGDQVKATDIVARAKLPGDLIIVRISEQMGIEPHEVQKGLKVKVGDAVEAGQLLCEHVGLFGLLKSRFISPMSGTVDFITEKIGHIALRMPSRMIEINAYISGKVRKLEDKKSVTIESSCAFVQGIFGVGGERLGKLKAIELNVNEEINESHIESDLQGRILFGGSRITISALKKAAQAGAVGIVTGSIDDKTLADYLGYDIGLALTGNENVPMTVILTEGFGNIPMSERAFAVLKEFENSEVSINGATQVRAGALRPEIIITHPTSFQAESSEAVARSSLEIGCSIRIIRVPYFGVAASVVELPHEMQKIETGAYARVLKAKLSDGKVVVVPRANVELVGS